MKIHSLACIVVPAAALCAAALLTGCGTTMNTVERAQPTGQRAMVDDKRILTDPWLNQRARIVGVNDSVTPAGFTRVQVELLNLRRSLKRFAYQFEWFDAQGMQVSTPANKAVVPIEVEGKESIFITAVAPTPACKDFRLKLLRMD